MFKKFEVVYVYDQAYLDFELKYAPALSSKTKEEVEELMQDLEMLHKSLTKPRKSERWVVKYRITWFWLFCTEHKLYLRSRSENGAIAQAKKFALGDNE